MNLSDQGSEAGRALAGKVRRLLLGRFPYGLLYTLNPDAIRILAVMNVKRRPAVWNGVTAEDDVFLGPNAVLTTGSP